MDKIVKTILNLPVLSATKFPVGLQSHVEDVIRVDFGLTSSPTSVGLFLGGEVVSYKRTPPPPISMYQNILFSLLIEVVPLCGARRLSYFAELRSKFLSSFSIFNIQYY